MTIAETSETAPLPTAHQDIPVRVWRDGVVSATNRTAAEEAPVAISYNGSCHAVMMATPADLDDFAIGFSLAEGIVASPAQIESLEVRCLDHGIELQMWLDRTASEKLVRRRRTMAGPVGCGLCGIDSLEQAMRPLPLLPAGKVIPAETVDKAIATLAPFQTLNQLTRAVHAAAFVPIPVDGSPPTVREDVGRHNALDKLSGALLRSAQSPEQGIVVVTSRLSVEMVQKAAMMAAPVLIAVSAPTALAVRVAEEIGLTLICVARSDGFEVVTHPHRIVFPQPAMRETTFNGA